MVGFGQIMVRAVVAGKLGTTQTWSTSLWLNLGLPAPEPSQAQLDQYATAVAAAFKPSLQTVASNAWSNSVVADHLTCYWYDSNTTKSALVSTAAPLAVTGVGTGSLPYFTSLVASLRTGTPGRSGRGRNYLPLLVGGVVGGNGQLGQTAAQNIAGAWASGITSINEIAAGTINPQGQQVAVASFTKGTPFRVTSVVVDTIPDTQHRRNDQLSPVAVTTATVP